MGKAGGGGGVNEQAIPVTTWAGVCAANDTHWWGGALRITSTLLMNPLYCCSTRLTTAAGANSTEVHSALQSMSSGKHATSPLKPDAK
uniref:Uncharacterized protein n=1 Tax=Mesocestoides corti TaxID=53468 RepID=A0A5K3G4X3_MESCO